MIIDFRPEFGLELTLGIPYAYWLHQRGELEKVITCKGMKPFYYFCDNILEKYEIDLIYTHWAGDSNQDHTSTFKTTMAAARYVKNVYCYEQIPIPRHTENQMRINHYVNITDTFDDKIKVSEGHKSQYDKYKKAGFDVTENLTTLAKFRGIQAKCKYAEAFQIIKQVM